MQFDRIFIKLKNLNPEQRREGTSSPIDSTLMFADIQQLGHQGAVNDIGHQIQI